MVPQIWTYEHTLAGGQPARAFVWMQGHEYANFANYQIQQMLLRGIAWAAHKPVDTLVDYVPPPPSIPQRGAGYTAITKRSLPRRPATVDQDIGSGDKASCIGAQIAGKRANLLHFAPSPDRKVRHELRVHFWIVHQREIHVCRDRSRADAVHCDSISSHFQRQCSA